jgi:nicotinamidase-related amidase
MKLQTEWQSLWMLRGIIKHDYDAFFETELDNILKEKGVKTVIIIGAYASVCIDETAGGARQHGYNIVVPADLTADIDSPDERQTPENICQKLHKIKNVTGYMPLGDTILSIWHNQNQAINS